VEELKGRKDESEVSLELQKDDYRQKVQQTAGYICICMDQPF
jgi:hypothetical protein